MKIFNTDAPAFFKLYNNSNSGYLFGDNSIFAVFELYILGIYCSYAFLCSFNKYGFNLVNNAKRR